VAAVSLHDGLVGYWQLNEGSGVTANDVAGPTGGVGSGFVDDNGTLTAGPTWLTDGKFNAGMNFNGTSQYVTIPASSDMDINTQGVTISAWVKLDQLPSVIVPGFGGILDSQPDNFVMYLDKANAELRFKATTAQGFSTATAQHPGIREAQLNTTDWIHVMGVFDGVAGRSMIYMNGQLIDKTGQSAASQDLRGTVRAGQISSIGAQLNATTLAPSNFFPGSVSDLAVWNRSLGAAEAQYLYNGGTGNRVGAANPDIAPLPGISPVQPTAQPVIYYKFDSDVNNYGTGGATYNATLHDSPGFNDTLFTPATHGNGLNLSQNTINGVNGVAPNGSNGDYLSVDYQLPESGTIATRFAVGPSLYNFQTMWANSKGNDDWEAWVYVDGRMATRATSPGNLLAHNLFMLDDPTASHHYAFTWERQGSNVLTRLYVNGEWVDERLTLWNDPGTTFFIGAGGGPTGLGNHLSTGLFDEFRIYTTALTEAEILYLSQNAPETVFGVPGDFNGDSVVNAADYVLWRDRLGSGTALPNDNSLGTPIDDDHYALWKANFGNSLGSGSVAATVPEPGSISLAFLICVVGYLVVKSRRFAVR